MPVVPDEDWICTTDSSGAAACRPSGGLASRLSLTSSFVVNGRSTSRSSESTPSAAAPNFRR